MKITNVVVIGLFVLGIVGFVFVHLAIAQVIDPCPKTTPKASVPCPAPDNITIYDNCYRPVCTGYTSYSADTKNTGYTDATGETYTKSVSYDAPASYKCATYSICEMHPIMDVCVSVSKPRNANGKLYSQHACDGSY